MAYIASGHTGTLRSLLMIEDIEETIESSHPHVRKGCIAAFALPQGNAEVLGVAVEVDTRPEDFDAPSVVQAIRRSVASKHQIDAHHVILLEAKSLPKTSSGKIQRFRARQEYLEGSASVVTADILGD